MENTWSICFQGFHIILDSINGFGGLAASAAQYLSEEYASKSIFAFPSAHGYYVDSEASKEGLRMSNLALCLQSLSTYCSLIVPLSTSRTYWQQKSTPRDFDHLHYDVSISKTCHLQLIHVVLIYSLPYLITPAVCWQQH
jgi:hypothetical protein